MRRGRPAGDVEAPHLVSSSVELCQGFGSDIPKSACEQHLHEIIRAEDL